MYAVIEILFSLALFINALLFIPQVIKIIREKSAKSISLLTFTGFNLIQLTMMAHGLIHHDTLLIIGTGLSLITCGMVTVLTFYYEGKERLLGLFRKKS